MWRLKLCWNLIRIAKNCWANHQKLRNRHRTDSSSQPSEGTKFAYQHCDLECLACRTVRHFLMLKPSSWCDFVMTVPKNEWTMKVWVNLFQCTVQFCGSTSNVKIKYAKMMKPLASTSNYTIRRKSEYNLNVFKSPPCSMSWEW